MGKTLIPEGLKGKPLFKFLIENKEALITEKKSIIKHSDPLSHSPTIEISTKSGTAKKDAGDAPGDNDEPMTINGGLVHVTVVANTANWVDSQLDMLLPDCWKRSIKQRKGMIPHLHDHIHQVECKIGEVTKIYSLDMALKDLGVDIAGSTQVLIFETDVLESYNEKIYNQYKLGKINQHSIGLQYVNISLCINDEDSEKEFDFWNKYYPLVINKDAVDERGYFWVVSEIRLLENSCVLFGANELTPTLDVKANTEKQPPAGIVKDPSLPFDVLGAIKSMAICKNCKTVYNHAASEGRCPMCGQYGSSQNTSDEVNMLSAIAGIKLFN